MSTMSANSPVSLTKSSSPTVRGGIQNYVAAAITVLAIRLNLDLSPTEVALLLPLVTGVVTYLQNFLEQRAGVKLLPPGNQVVGKA